MALTSHFILSTTGLNDPMLIPVLDCHLIHVSDQVMSLQGARIEMNGIIQLKILILTMDSIISVLIADKVCLRPHEPIVATGFDATKIQSFNNYLRQQIKILN